MSLHHLTLCNIQVCCQTTVDGGPAQHRSVWCQQHQGGRCVCAGDPGVLCMGLHQAGWLQQHEGKREQGCVCVLRLCLCAICPAVTSGHVCPSASLSLGRDPNSLGRRPVLAPLNTYCWEKPRKTNSGIHRLEYSPLLHSFQVKDQTIILMAGRKWSTL